MPWETRGIAVGRSHPRRPCPRPHQAATSISGGFGSPPPLAPSGRPGPPPEHLTLRRRAERELCPTRHSTEPNLSLPVAAVAIPINSERGGRESMPIQRSVSEVGGGCDAAAGNGAHTRTAQSLHLFPQSARSTDRLTTH